MIYFQVHPNQIPGTKAQKKSATRRVISAAYRCGAVPLLKFNQPTAEIEDFLANYGDLLAVGGYGCVLFGGEAAKPHMDGQELRFRRRLWDQEVWACWFDQLRCLIDHCNPILLSLDLEALVSKPLFDDKPECKAAMREFNRHRVDVGQYARELWKDLGRPELVLEPPLCRGLRLKPNLKFLRAILPGGEDGQSGCPWRLTGEMNFRKGMGDDTERAMMQRKLVRFSAAPDWSMQMIGVGQNPDLYWNPNDFPAALAQCKATDPEADIYVHLDAPTAAFCADVLAKLHKEGKW